MHEDPEHPNPPLAEPESLQHDTSSRRLSIRQIYRRVATYIQIHRIRTLVAASLLVIVVAIGVSLLVFVPDSPKAEIKIAGWEFRQDLSLDATQTSAADTHPTTIGVNTLDISVKNEGPADAAITGARVEVLYAERLEDCAPSDGEAGTISPSYAVKLPTPLPSAPFTVNQSLQMPIKAGFSDHLILSIGPNQWLASEVGPYLMVARVVLTDDQSNNLGVGTAEVLSQLDAPDMMISWSGWDCIERNAKRIEKASAIPAKHSDDIDYMNTVVHNLLAVDPKTVQERCREWGESPAIPKICARRDLYQLGVTVTLASVPIMNETRLVVHLLNSETGQRYRFVAAPVRRDNATWPPATRPEWVCNGLETDEVKAEGFNDDSPLGVAAIFDADTQSVTISINGLPLGIGAAKSLDISAELKLLGPPQGAATVGATPPGDVLSIERGN